MKGKLLKVYPSVLNKVDDELWIEYDFCESVRLYLDNFDQVSVACPIVEEKISSLRRSRRVKDLPWRHRIKLIPLPIGYRFDQFLRHYSAVRRLLKAEVESADYLVFHPHTLVGDWPTIAIRDAIKLQRRYAIDSDVVYEKVAQAAWARDAAWKRFIENKAKLPLFQKSYRYCLKHSSLALLQGQDVYDAYSSFCGNPHKVHHMPVPGQDYITEAQLRNKLNGLTESRALRLCYVGRAVDMKGPMDWLKTLHALTKDGVEISATWLGDGPLLPSMRIMAESLGIADYVQFSGYVSDRQQIFRTLRDADLFVFCHQTPESPRCLVEALVTGCPLVGYGSAFAKDLVAQRGGGQFATIGNWRELADIVKNLNKNRERVRELIQLAADSGRLFERDVAMQRRIDLIKKYL